MSSRMMVMVKVMDDDVGSVVDVVATDLLLLPPTKRMEKKNVMTMPWHISNDGKV